MSLTSLTAAALGKKIRAGEISVKEAVEDALIEIRKKESDLNSFVTVDEEGAYRQAQEIQKKIEIGELNSVLAGVPAAVKDNLCTKGLLTTCGSKMLSDFVPRSEEHTSELQSH